MPVRSAAAAIAYSKMTRRKKGFKKSFLLAPKIHPLNLLGKGSIRRCPLGSKPHKKGHKLQLLVRQLLAAFNGKLASLQS
jgi:hypothetical protein